MTPPAALYAGKMLTMPVKAILLAGIIAAGAGLLFLIIVGWQWWRVMKKDPYRDMLYDERKKNG